MNKNNNKAILWDSNRLSSALSKQISLSKDIYDISIDSRSAKSGDIFFGLKGDKFNGSDFALDAVQKGASVCVVDHIPENCLHIPKDNFIVVDNVYQTMVKMAHFARSNFRGKIVAITGSVGKTTTSQMLYSVLKKLQINVFVNNNKNNMYGVPFSLCKMPKNCDIGIFELGMNSKGEIERLSEFVKPHIAVITNIYETHLKFFNNIDEIANAKSEIYKNAVSGGYAVINSDSPHCNFLKDQAHQHGLNIITFGYEKNADFQLLEYDFNTSKTAIASKTAVAKTTASNAITEANAFTTIRAICLGKEVNYTISGIGFDLVMNSLCVGSVIHTLGLDLISAMHNVNSFLAVSGRGNVIDLEHNITLIDDSYNASPASMKAALRRLKEYKKAEGRAIAILGDMRELGGDEIELHLSLLEEIEKNEIDKVFVVGEIMQYLFSKLSGGKRGISCHSAEEMSLVICDYLKSNDTIMIKGSNSINMKKIVDTICKNYSI